MRSRADTGIYNSSLLTLTRGHIMVWLIHIILTIFFLVLLFFITCKDVGLQGQGPQRYIIVKKNRSLNMSQVNDLGSIHPTNGWYCCSYLRSDMSEDETARCRIPSEKRRRFRVVYTRLREKPGWVMRCRLTVPYQRPSPDGVQAPPPYFILTPPQYAGRRDLSSTI